MVTINVQVAASTVCFSCFSCNKIESSQISLQQQTPGQVLQHLPELVRGNQLVSHVETGNFDEAK